MEAGANLLGKAGCRYTKEHVCKISGQYIHFHRSYDTFCKPRTFVLIYRPHPVLAGRIVRYPNDSTGSPLSICALRLAISIIL